MSRRLIAAAAAVLASLVLAAPAGGAVPGKFVGLVSDDVISGDAAYRAENLGLQRDIGVGLLRQAFYWSDIEREPGRYEFAFYDEYVSTAARYGIEILPILFFPPKFYSSESSVGTYPPRRPEQMGAFGAAVARRYGPNGSFWRERPDIPRVPIRSYQVWNEPNLKAYWPAGPNPRQYAKLLRVTSKAIKAVDPRADIVTAGIPDSKISKPYSWLRYIRLMYKARAKSGFDTLAINPYPRNARQLKKQLKVVRRVMNRRHDRRARLWVTEIGWADSGPRGRATVGPERQAANITNTFRLFGKQRKRLRIQGFVYYQWKDAEPYAPRYKDFWALHTGLFRRNGEAKPAFSAFKSAIAALRAP